LRTNDFECFEHAFERVAFGSGRLRARQRKQAATEPTGSAALLSPGRPGSGDRWRMIPKSECRVFGKRSCASKTLERDADSKKGLSL